MILECSRDEDDVQIRTRAHGNIEEKIGLFLFTQQCEEEKYITNDTHLQMLIRKEQEILAS